MAVVQSIGGGNHAWWQELGYGSMRQMIQEDSAASERCRRYSGCWGVAPHVFEFAAVVAVGGGW